MNQLRNPFGGDVLERDRIDNGEADEENICVCVAERTETIVLFLTSSIPNSNSIRFSSFAL
tara:strand:+ start:904 stop:1086 length:183 start_codon:yes stop_codon:yes gene_type:complete